MNRTTLRYLLAAGAVLAILIPSVAIGSGEGLSLKGGQRNPSVNPTRAYGAETEIIARTSTYGTRQSNKTDGDGGGAIYGCRSNPGREPCIRASNLKGGRAFEFATVGKEGGEIRLGDPTGAPFTTNATGVATGLNADKLDGKDAAELAAASDLRWAAVSAAGALTAKRGATAAQVLDATARTFTVTFDRDIDACSYTATPTGDALAMGVKLGTDKRTLVVDEPDATPAQPFHVQVVC